MSSEQVSGKILACFIRRWRFSFSAALSIASPICFGIPVRLMIMGEYGLAAEGADDRNIYSQ